MLDPVTELPFDASNTLLVYLLGGVVFIIISILLIILIFALVAKKSLDSLVLVGITLIISLSIVGGVIMVGRRTYFQTKAANQVEIMNIQITSIDDDYFLVTYDSTEPEISYIEVVSDDETIIPILPTYSLTKKTEHSVIVPKEIRKEEVSIVIRGQRKPINL